MQVGRGICCINKCESGDRNVTKRSKKTFAHYFPPIITSVQMIQKGKLKKKKTLLHFIMPDVLRDLFLFFCLLSTI